jgi:hypothetical protein
MVKCDNCVNPASYTQADPGVNPVNYCQKCLPGWLHSRALAGHFPLVEPVADATKTTRRKKAAYSDESD